MLKHKYIDYIIYLLVFLGLILTLIFIRGEDFGLTRESAQPPYMEKLFEQNKVHTIDIQMPDPDFKYLIDNALAEEYMNCNLNINGEDFKNVALRVKGNNSKSLTHKYGHERFSFKVEFDHYKDGRTYYGLDKLSLNASFQDNSYLKDHMAFHMMDFMGAPAPLSSYIFLTVNGQDWGLYLGIEDIEDSFAKRVYGNNHGKIYKPDYRSLKDENKDIALIYTDDDFKSYDNIFRGAKFKVSDADKSRLISSLKVLASGENLESVLNIEEIVNYLVVQSFVVNLDSYLGPTGHNYFLYEKNGLLEMLPWDYNLAFATYPLAMPNPINDSTYFVNYPINTPAPGYVMLNRPMFHNLMKNRNYYDLYHERYEHFIEEYFFSGYFLEKVNATVDMISPYVDKDPTKFITHEDFLLGVETFKEFSRLRAQSIRGQLDGSIASSFKEGESNKNRIDASHIWIPDMGEIDDLKK